MTFTNPANRYAVEIHGERGWVAFMAYPTLARAERLALNLISHDIPVRILDLETGHIVWAQ